MGESQVHLELVQRLVQYAAWRFREYPAVAVYADLPTTPRREKPPRVGGFVPDVYASDVPTTFSLVGEAKTLEDIESPRTALQLAAFLRHVRVCQGSIVIAVPSIAISTARHCPRRIAVMMDAEHVEYAIIDEVSAWR